MESREMMNDEDQTVVYQSLQNDAFLAQTNQEQQDQQTKNAKHLNDNKMESLNSKDLNVNDKEALIEFYQAQAAQDTFRQ